MTKAEKLRELLQSNITIRVAGAHNGLSAKLVEQAGFDAIWASGFEISASYGLPDTSILTMTQFLEIASQMEFVTNIPIIADCDSGYGDRENVQHLVKKYERLKIAGVCIEDQKFPKINSLMHSSQPLVSIDEFTDKIRAAKDAQSESAFVVIARTDALTVGESAENTLKRANAYAEAGADAVLIHSKAKTPDEIISFMANWHGKIPVVVVPTTYPALTIPVINKLEIKMVIYANQGLRSAVRAMKQTFYDIYRDGHAQEIEKKIATLEEIFELQGIKST